MQQPAGEGKRRDWGEGSRHQWGDGEWYADARGEYFYYDLGGGRVYYKGEDYTDDEARRLVRQDSGEDYFTEVRDVGDAEPRSSMKDIGVRRIRPTTNPPTAKAVGRNAMMK